MTHHTPPCTDPSCMPCWWDALDAETYPVITSPPHPEEGP